MSIFLRLLPIILISVIFYILIYNLYPKYQELISLTKKLNELQNKEKELNALLKLIQALSQNPNIQQLAANREVLDLWLPQEPKAEEILAFLVSIYQTNNLVFKGTNLSITEESKVYNANVLPVKVINFSLEAELDNSNMISFIESLEKSARLMVIKKAQISSDKKDKKSQIEVEAYYLSEK
jgi:Tfp pilus assembly protein PilO